MKKFLPSFKTLSFFILGVITGAAIHNNQDLLKDYVARGVMWWSMPDFRWTMVNVNHTTLQGDAHLIQIRDGQTILIDAGYEQPAKEKLMPWLKQNYVKQIDRVFISHPHRDHYEGLFQIVKSGIRVKEVYFHVPDRALCDAESPRCVYQSVLDMKALLENRKIPLLEVENGQELDLGGGALMRVLNVSDAIHTPIGPTNKINDMSMVLQLEFAGHKILFTGDLGEKMGQYVAETSDQLKSEILKVPHHGGRSLVPNVFFDKVSPEYSLVPAPAWLWCDERADQARNWHKNHHIPVYVNGFHGHIQVIIHHARLSFNTEIPPSPMCE
ncbi:MAG: MBL fold metallo-hydrolase [SAR324 cluster bacterium]|nr:MBL fold metallo-hydrolase [SAR324 cluster bacterium]